MNPCAAATSANVKVPASRRRRTATMPASRPPTREQLEYIAAHPQEFGLRTMPPLPFSTIERRVTRLVELYSRRPNTNVISSEVYLQKSQARAILRYLNLLEQHGRKKTLT